MGEEPDENVMRSYDDIPQFDEQGGEDDQSDAATMLAGSIEYSSSRFGMLKQDNGEADLFVLPADCQAFDGQIPPVGTRVQYTEGFDEEKGEAKADNVQPEGMQKSKDANSETVSAPVSVGAHGFGEITKSQERFGYLKQDSGEQDLFVLPRDCEAFGGVIPPRGTRVSYVVGLDRQKGLPKAEQVGPETTQAVPLASPYGKAYSKGKGKDKGKVKGFGETDGAVAAAVDAESIVLLSGTVSRGEGKFGYLQQDNGEPDLFVLPTDCQAFGASIPPKGTRVLYSVGVDAKKGLPKADNVQPEHSLLSGTITRGQDRFGYLKQDNGEPDIFVLPLDCQAFGRAIPPRGTRVLYSVGVDPKKGEPKAENVQPEVSSGYVAEEYAHFAAPPSQANFVEYAAPSYYGGLLTGTITKEKDGRFGYLAQDNGDVDLFVLPGDCAGFGGVIPPMGTRVLYSVGVDSQKGKPKAEQVQPEAGGASASCSSKGKGKDVGWQGKGKAAGFPRPSRVPVYDPTFDPAAAGSLLAGTITRGEDRFGYLQQDNGEPDLFVLPGDCPGFGEVIPPRGTRVVYSIGVDSKKNLPKAVQVYPESDASASASSYGKAMKGKGNGFVNGGSTGSFAKQMQASAFSAPGLLSGMITKSAGKYGYLRQDSGEPDLFVLPGDCTAFGREIPPAGTPVLYVVGVDEQKGRPKAEQIQPVNGPGPAMIQPAWSRPY